MADEVVIRLKDIESGVFDSINSSRELRRAMKRFIDDVHDTWLNVWDASMEGVLAQETGDPHPYQTGDYRASIKKRNLPLRQRLFIKSTLRKGIPIGLVYSDDEKAHWIEYGTDPDKPGGHSPWGPDTPTPAFAPMTRTSIIMNEGFEVT